jgi:hypothetical protein
MKKLLCNTDFIQKVSEFSLTYDGSALKKCARFTEGVAEIRQPKGGRMGCLMKEKLQGLAERKAFILLFLIVWELVGKIMDRERRFSLELGVNRSGWENQENSNDCIDEGT